MYVCVIPSFKNVAACVNERILWAFTRFLCFKISALLLFMCLALISVIQCSNECECELVCVSGLSHNIFRFWSIISLYKFLEFSALRHSLIHIRVCHIESRLSISSLHRTQKVFTSIGLYQTWEYSQTSIWFRLRTLKSLPTSNWTGLSVSAVFRVFVLHCLHNLSIRNKVILLSLDQHKAVHYKYFIHSLLVHIISWQIPTWLCQPSFNCNEVHWLCSSNWNS